MPSKGIFGHGFMVHDMPFKSSDHSIQVFFQ